MQKYAFLGHAHLTGEQHDGSVVTAQYVGEYMQGMDTSLIVPGVSWHDVAVTDGAPGDADVTIRATLVADDVVNGGDWNGQQMSADFIRDYLDGAQEYAILTSGLTLPKENISLSPVS